MALSDDQFYGLLKTHAHEPDENGDCKLCGLGHEDVPPGPCVASLLATMRDMKVELAFPLEQLNLLEQAVRKAASIRVAMTGEAGKFLQIEGASLKVVHPQKPRVTWNGQGLDGYSVAHPEILMFRTEKWAKPSITPEIE